MPEKVDVAIIGAGTAGLSALREVEKATERFVLIDAGDWGTTCAARGCMPSKALIEAANAWHRRHAFDGFGIRGAEGLTVDVPAVLARVRALRDDFVQGPQSTPGRLGDRAIHGRATLLGPDRLRVGDREIAARSIILAPGSTPVVPAPWRRLGDRILTSDSLFELQDLPRRIAVIGLGAIGVELAQAMARLGCRVTGFDAAEQIGGLDDAHVAAVLHNALGREVDLRLGASADLAEGGDGLQVSGAGDPVTVDAVLVALGRRPAIDGLGLEALGVPLDDAGLPQVDPTTQRIGDLPVFLAGDANGHRPILHEAADEGHIAGRNAAAGCTVARCRRTPLAIVFSAPQVARVGVPLADCDPESTAVGEVNFARQGRARTAAVNEGLLRVHADRASGRLLGAEMCAPAAEHMAHLLGLAVERAMTVPEVLSMPIYHPVLEEGLRSALRQLARELPTAGGSDLSRCDDLGHAALD